MRAGALAIAALFAFGCGPRERPALPSAPSVTSAEDLIPADLDVALRVDMARMKVALGSVTSTALAEEALRVGSAAGGDAPDPLLIESLLRADRVYLAYRPNESGLPSDRVFALEGSFEPITAPPRGFGLPVDLGADLRFWERKPGTPLARGAVARIYAQGDRLRAFVSEAEIDAVERAVTVPPSARRLSPPAEGALSLAVRPALLAGLASGSLRELLVRAESLSLTLQLEADRARLRGELVLRSAEDAQALSAAGKLVLERVPSLLGASSELTTDGERLVLVAEAKRERIAPLLGCLDRSGRADCPW